MKPREIDNLVHDAIRFFAEVNNDLEFFVSTHSHAFITAVNKKNHLQARIRQFETRFLEYLADAYKRLPGEANDK